MTTWTWVDHEGTEWHYDWCQRRDNDAVYVVREIPGAGVTGAYGPLSEAQVDALMKEHQVDIDRYGVNTALAGLDYDADPSLAAWLRDNPGEWGYSLRRMI